MAPRLKVFVTSDGFTDYIVATTSRAKALAAWGLRQDVFKEGRAHETDDPDLVAAATAQPDQVLRRPAGTRDSLAKLKPPSKAKPKGTSPAALKKVADLEAKLADLEASHEEALAEIEEQRATLERRAGELVHDYHARREKLEAALSGARAALEP
ncbi:hypothetical protein [Phenylobacterium deserti]|uniref:Cell envelope biogenesis protein TolA n=1 Tax=Phenylobacterium deserti TaxID=1914756 RepID=A0A328AFS0_9CAUL|nr:hypothetical protein [Phenylobacterium deserti]RAK52264.1 hypothetical protein DJ018_14070 [Phenylobacterium deserti]